MSCDTIIFPYGITLREGGALEIFPAAEISFSVPQKEWVTLFLIIDSGATISALPKSDASVLGVDAERGRPISIAGINGEVTPGWQHEHHVRIGEDAIKIPLAFLDNETSPRVLGRAGIFDRFIVIFEEQKKRSGFIGKNSKEAGAVSIIFDKLEK
ncbi:MAG: aspartyl protease family protein [bacterium]|nr:aspartyl protease family protein [bacterium]